MQANPASRNLRAGFTLVELLVVVTIIGILVMLLLPAVQSARESARRTTCMNNLKQIANAFQQHETKWGHLPSGGWGWGWTGDPDLGFGKDQPGSWTYAILPFIEQQNLYDMGTDGSPQANRPEHSKRMQVPLLAVNCPTRRTPQVYRSKYGYYNANQSPFVNKSDYAANSGNQDRNENMGGPHAWEDGLDVEWWKGGKSGVGNYTCPPHAVQSEVNKDSNGVCFQRSTISHTHIAKGSAQTYMVGEKYLNRDNYSTGEDSADNESAFTGYNNDLHRGNGQPMQDRRGHSTTKSFGSAHAGGFHMAFCDGHVERIEYGIALNLHRALMTRKVTQGTVIDDKGY